MYANFGFLEIEHFFGRKGIFVVSEVLQFNFKLKLAA